MLLLQPDGLCTPYAISCDKTHYLSTFRHGAATSKRRRQSVRNTQVAKLVYLSGSRMINESVVISTKRESDV